MPPSLPSLQIPIPGLILPTWSFVSCKYYTVCMWLGISIANNKLRSKLYYVCGCCLSAMHYLLLSPSLHTHTHPSTHTHTCILLPTHPLIHSLAFSPDHEVEAPAGVGFSYSDNPSVDYKTDDNITALDNYKFLVNWFSNYSEYKANDFYVTYVCNTVVFLLQEGVSNCLVCQNTIFPSSL